jgi:hypothetical protein
MKKILIAIGLAAIAAGVAIHVVTGSVAPRPAASQPPAAPIPAAASGPASQESAAPIASPEAIGPAQPSAVAASKAPWSSLQARYRKGDYAWLLANARSAPEKGSYTMALKALAPCFNLLKRGNQDYQAGALERSEPDPQLRAVKRAALQAMFARCANLPDAQALGTQLAALTAERAAAGDAMWLVERDMPGLVETRLPKEARQRRLEELLAMNDASVATLMQNMFIRPGVTFDGAAVSAADLVPYQAAWALAMCSEYGECGGAGSVQADENCLYRGNCDYLDTWQTVQRELPPSMTERARSYYTRMHDNLSRGNYGAFGVN